MNKQDENKLKCSFCGKTQGQVRRLIAGPGVFICDECVELCMDIIEEELSEQMDDQGGVQEKLKLLKPAEIAAILSEYVIAVSP